MYAQVYGEGGGGVDRTQDQASQPHPVRPSDKIGFGPTRYPRTFQESELLATIREKDCCYLWLQYSDWCPI